MRLAALDHGHRWRERTKLWLIRTLRGVERLDIIQTFLYRPNFFGRPFLAVIQSVLRGHSRWSVGERELFAAFVSKLNQCHF